MPSLSVVNFNIVCATLGGFITSFGLVSYLLKEKFYMSEALISTFAGLASSPHAANFIKPLQYANGSVENLETITLYFSRLVLGVQLVLAGVQLPSKYLWKEWKSLSWLLGPGMCAMWIATTLLVWALVPDIDFLFALAIGACVTPTDPVLSNSIVKGKFADKNIPPPLQKMIIAESGANDGLGYPFLFFALYLIKYVGDNGAGTTGGAGRAMGLWFYETWAYTILLSVAYGAVVGWIAKELLHWAEEKRYVDRESFLVFAITLALFIVGTVGMIGSDDVLACFIAGNAFTWDDWFRQETEDDSLQPTIDMLLNVSIFMWYGAVCPWHKFVTNNAIPIYRLIPLGILVLLLRRLPMILGFHKFHAVHQIDDIKRATFVGFFGPIGVSAIFYLYITREFLRGVRPSVEGETMSLQGERPDAAHLSEAVEVVVWFLVICSIIVHGLSIPVGKLGFYLPRTISNAISSERFSTTSSMASPEDGAVRPSWRPRERSEERVLRRHFQRRRPTTSELGPAQSDAKSIFWPFRAIAGFGSRVAHDFKRTAGQDSADADEQGREGNRADSSAQGGVVDHGGTHPEISRPTNPRIIGHTINHTFLESNGRSDVRSPSPHRSVGVEQSTIPKSSVSPPSPRTETTFNAPFPNRSILFADESRAIASRSSSRIRQGLPRGGEDNAQGKDQS